MNDLNTIVLKVTKTTKSDLYIFSAEINIETADEFIEKIRNKQKKEENCSLILTTFGGDPNAGYRIIRTIKRCYKKLFLYIFGFCKSTGTLIALGADEIIMGDFGEFGPLDIQLTKEDELLRTSGLNFIQSLYSLNEILFKSFEKNFLTLKRRSAYTITTKTAAEISSKLAVGLISPISAQIDPIKLGEVYRAMRIAEHYGKRISNNEDLISRLILDYPSHEFVIDFKEAQEIFGNVRQLNADEIILEQQLLFQVVRYEGEKIIEELIPKKDNDNKKEKNLKREKGLNQKEQKKIIKDNGEHK